MKLVFPFWNKIVLFYFISWSLLPAQGQGTAFSSELQKSRIYTDSKPWTRWWWFASEIKKTDIADNLTWLKENGFGGVEIAWVYPLNRMKKDTVHYTPRQAWLSPEWSEMVVVAKKCADSLGLGCDFTFGSLWPFGDTKVPWNEATMNMNDTNWRQDIAASWEYPKKGLVIDHLNRNAFSHYAERTGNALKPALKGTISGLFCDSWEVETRYLSTTGFTGKFRAKYGYGLENFKDSLFSKNEQYGKVRYDYMKLISDLVIEEFYKPFTRKCHELGAYSRVQCSGAPCDIISAYATVDVPESEALLYEPSFSNIVASAAALSGKKVVTSETFTCLYGWPRDHRGEEQTADLKLLADAIFANGVNQVIWHGKPFNPAGQDSVKFYASVHVGKSGSLAKEIPAFNRYMEKVSGYMKRGVPLSRVAVYLPTEDAWIAGDLPKEKQFIWAWGEYEMRYAALPQDLKAWRPLWINGEFLQKAEFRDGLLRAGDLSFPALYVDVKFMDISSLKRILELVQKGMPLCLKQYPSEPGMKKSREYDILLNNLRRFPNVKNSWTEMENIPPFVSGCEQTDFWCRETRDGLYFFFANPKAKNLVFPLEYGQSLNSETFRIKCQVNYQEKTVDLDLVFEPYQSLLYKIRDGKAEQLDINFIPALPVVKKRPEDYKAPWVVR